MRVAVNRAEKLVLALPKGRILDEAMPLVRAAGIEPRPAMEFDGIEAIKSAVAAGLGMAIVPSPAMSQGPPVNNIIARPLEPPLKRTLGLVERRGRAWACVRR